MSHPSHSLTPGDQAHNVHGDVHGDIHGDVHGHDIGVDDYRHSHAFLGKKHARNESRVLIVSALTAVTMVAEIACGTWFGSMALLADGWHMATHMLALGIAALAYRYAR